MTERRLSTEIRRHGFKIVERVRQTHRRRETLEALTSRVQSPPEGWPAFLGAFERVARERAPELSFSFDADTVEYDQHWLTVWSKPESA